MVGEGGEQVGALLEAEGGEIGVRDGLVGFIEVVEALGMADEMESDGHRGRFRGG